MRPGFVVPFIKFRLNAWGSEKRKGKERLRRGGSLINIGFITTLSCVADKMCPKLLFLTSFPYHGLRMRPWPGNEVRVLPRRPGIQPETLQKKFVHHDQHPVMPLHGPKWSYVDHRTALSLYE